MAKDKCDCRPALGLFGMVLLALGLYFIIWGFMTQMASTISWSLWSWTALLYYLIGLFLLGFGKIAKYKGYMQCKMHCMKK